MAIKKFRKYELVYLVQPEATDDERARVADRIAGVFATNEAWILSQEEWGKRRLSYEIQKHNKAHYHYMTYIAAPKVTAELERVLRLQDACIRFLTIKLEDQIPEGRVPELTAAAASAAEALSAAAAAQSAAAAAHSAAVAQKAAAAAAAQNNSAPAQNNAAPAAAEV
jgi:small subunit ribosomal protein S6